jgi:hypothetical protein
LRFFEAKENQRSMRKSKRVLFKPKVFGFNPYTDQVPAIKQIMEETGQESEAPVLRMLLDEALRARRQKAAGVQPPQQPPPAQELGQCLETIRVLLLKLICQGETGFRIGSISLELMQEALAEARAGRVGMWETLIKPSLRERGRSAQEIASLFEAQIKEGQEFAYGLAGEIRDQLLAAAEAEERKAKLEESHSPTLLLENGFARDDGEMDLR